MKTLFAIFTGTVVALGAASAANAVATAKDVTYSCAGGKSITITYTGDNGDTAVFEDAGESIVLDQAKSGSGVRYVSADKNYTYELVTKGKTATVYSAPDEVWLKDCVAK